MEGSNSKMNLEYKLILVGNGGVGKTAYIKRIRTGEFEEKYFTTIGAEVHPISFETNYGKLIFNVWDCSGQEQFSVLKDD